MGRIVSLDELLALLGPANRGARRVAFTNGCFDLLHPGHIQSLEQIRAMADVLVVAINSDRSVRRLKGDSRPVTPEGERAEILAALAAVDYVVIFDQETPREVIARLLPDLLAKGADWQGAIVGREEVEAAGGQVISVPMEPGYSTTRILEKIRATPSDHRSSSASGKPQQTNR